MRGTSKSEGHSMSKKTSEAPAAKKGDRRLVYALMALGVVVILAIVALLLAVPAITVLFFIFGPATPHAVEVSACTFPPGIACSAFAVGTDGSLNLMIGQALGHPIRVDGIACAPPASGTPDSFTPVRTEIPVGEQRWVSGPLAGAAARCGSGGPAGEFARWKVFVRYTELDTGIQRTGVGDLAARYAQIP